jgi:gluconolactonase
MKSFAICCAALINGAVFVALNAQAPETGPTKRVDPGFDAIVSPGTTMEILRSDFGFINGIVWVRESGGGHLLISDIPANVVHRWTPDGKLSAFLEKPDWTRTTGRPENPRFGANGITVDPQGRVVYAAEADRAIVRLEKDGKRTILAESYEGKRLNSPNDLVFRSDGALYFTDPSGGNRFANWDLKKELPTASTSARSCRLNSPPASRSAIPTGNHSTWQQAPSSHAFASRMPVRGRDFAARA